MRAPKAIIPTQSRLGGALDLYEYIVRLTNVNMQAGVQPQRSQGSQTPTDSVIIDPEMMWTTPVINVCNEKTAPRFNCETVIIVGCNFTDRVECKQMTLPPKCDTSEAQNCQTKGQCTKHQGCKDVSIAPACRTSSPNNPDQCSTSQGGCYTADLPNNGCTSKLACEAMTVFPACSTNFRCLTLFGGCTNNAFCQGVTLPPKCQTSENDLCQITWKQGCPQTAQYNCYEYPERVLHE